MDFLELLIISILELGKKGRRYFGAGGRYFESQREIVVAVFLVMNNGACVEPSWFEDSTKDWGTRELVGRKDRAVSV